MNTYQACRRLKSILRSLRWGGSGDNVFARDSVFVTMAPLRDSVPDLRMPAAFVTPLSARADESSPGLFTQQIAVDVLVSAPGDMFGEAPLMGRNRISKTSNEGRGLLQIESEMMDTLKLLNASNQFAISLQNASAPLPEIFDETNYHVRREYTFEALLTTDKMFDHPRSASLSDSGGTVTISWTVPDDATNLTGYVVRRASGTIPVAFPTSGTDVPWSSGTSTTDAPGSGTFSYAVFAAYDSLGGAILHEYSDYSFGTVTV